MWLLSIAQMLTVVATGAQPGMSAGQAVGNEPDPIPTRQTYFAIPFEIDQMDHPTLGAAEIQLFVSRDRGGTWQHETSVSPTTKNFLFRAPNDGEYWFAVRTRDKAGNLRPPLINAPGLRVVVDTQAPTLSIEAQRGPAGQIIAKWKIDEANIKPETLKLQYRGGEGQPWEDVAVDLSKMQTDAAASSGESIWWAPAGQGRIEIRVEVADAAGNRNVSHAQVMTVASAAPPANGIAQAPETAAPSAGYEANWQASSNQSASSQQTNDSTGSAPAQTSPAYDPYQQGYGSGAAQTASERLSGSSYNPDANSSYSTGGGMPGYDSPGASSSGSDYGVDPNTTAQNPQSSAAAPSQPSGRSQYGQYGQSEPSQPQQQYGQYTQNKQPESQYDQYAQNQPSQPQQQYGQYPSQPGYGSQETTEPYETQTNRSGYGTQDRSGAGTVAAQPAPAYQSQYDPRGATTQGNDRPTVNGYGSSSDYGSSTQRSTGPAAPQRTVNTSLFEIDYTNPPQPLAVGRVELWGTRDGGVTWQSYGFDSDSRSPMLARVPNEGTYGFHVVFHPMHGQRAQPPQRGQTPDMLICVDLTRPNTQVVGVEQSRDGLTIRWLAADARLADTPITLKYADAATGQWRVIAQNVDNSGSYRWTLPIGLPPEVQIRVEARDTAGNVATAETHRPIRLAKAPGARSGPSQHSVEVQNVRPFGQSGQSGPQRYIIR